MFPQSLQWLLSHQREDGSWGSEMEHYHERVISTLASIMAIFEQTPGKVKQDKVFENVGWDFAVYVRLLPYGFFVR